LLSLRSEEGGLTFLHGPRAGRVLNGELNPQIELARVLDAHLFLECGHETPNGCLDVIAVGAELVGDRGDCADALAIQAPIHRQDLVILGMLSPDTLNVLAQTTKVLAPYGRVERVVVGESLLGYYFPLFGSEQDFA
jgi:hypothetical protein